MSTKKRWTEEEEKIKVKAMKANQHKITKTFRKVAKKLGRTEAAVSIQWYTKTRNSSVCFVTISQGKKFKNGKNYVPNCKHINSPTPSNKTLWEKLKALLEWK